MAGSHRYAVSVRWTGDRGSGTTGYRDYDRDHVVAAPGKPDLPGSSDPQFRGDPGRWSPEELLVVSLSQCHMLWYLHLAAVAGIVVTGYVDQASGTMALEPGGAGQFTEVVLRPAVTVAAPSMVDGAGPVHAEAAKMCFIARSVNFPVRHEPTVSVRESDSGR
jgi:organic hydroperoxide reductase OsmC/OhrA